MATLQAARAYTLGLPLDSAYSWGLDRAIFYAAAKRGFKGRPATGKGAEARVREPQGKDVFTLGDEMAFKKEVDGKVYFTIGGTIQTKEDFSRQIESRFTDLSFKDAWDESLKIVSKYDKDTLLSGKEFFEAVYRPRRDELAKKWS